MYLGLAWSQFEGHLKQRRNGTDDPQDLEHKNSSLHLNPAEQKFRSSFGRKPSFRFRRSLFPLCLCILLLEGSHPGGVPAGIPPQKDNPLEGLRMSAEYVVLEFFVFYIV